MRALTINKNDAGQRLDKFLQKSLSGFPPALMHKCLRKKDIRVNNRRAEAGQILCEGDEVLLYINEEFFAKKPFSAEKADIKAVYEDENILVIDKPPGVFCQSGNAAGKNALADRLKSYLYRKGEYDPEKEQSFSPALCNRLDVNTGGLVIGAKNAAALREMNARIRNREVKKYYLCRTEGAPPQKEALLKGHITKDAKRNKSAVGGKGKEIAAVYRVVDGGGDLVEIELITGRSHQIRAQMSALGCPIKGDRKYGAHSGGGQKLCAYKLVFDFTSEGLLSYLDQKEFLSGYTI